MIWMFDTFPIAVGGVISISNRVLHRHRRRQSQPGRQLGRMVVLVVGFRGVLGLSGHAPSHGRAW